MNPAPASVRQILVCGGKHCRKRADCKLAKRLRKAVAKHCPDRPVKVVKTDCLGKCEDGPVVAVHPGDLWFACVGRQTARAIVKRSIRRGKPVKGARLLKPSLRRIRAYLR